MRKVTLLKLWRLGWEEGKAPKFRSVRLIIALAEDESLARLLAAAHCGDDLGWAWMDEERTFCEEFNAEGERRVIALDNL